MLCSSLHNFKMRWFLVVPLLVVYDHLIKVLSARHFYVKFTLFLSLISISGGVTLNYVYTLFLFSPSVYLFMLVLIHDFLFYWIGHNLLLSFVLMFKLHIFCQSIGWKNYMFNCKDAKRICHLFISKDRLILPEVALMNSGRKQVYSSSLPGACLLHSVYSFSVLFNFYCVNSFWGFPYQLSIL